MSYARPMPLAGALAVRRGERDLQELLDDVAARIDATEPAIQALLPEPDRRARLLAEAEALVARYPDPSTRPPLFGVLVGVKDIFHAAGFVTRAGTTVPPEFFAGQEARCVTALKAAGALVLGKTVTTEFAFYEPGPTRNPHDPDRTPGGSSSGSAAAVAAGFSHLALGTQTIGSMIRPAAYCGIAGFKPTFGRIDTAGVVPFSASGDHVGLFAADAAGLAPAAAVVCRDWAPNGDPGRPTLGMPEGPYLDQAPPSALDALAAQVVHLEAAGYVVRRVPVLADIAVINTRHRRMAAAELAQVHAAWFSEHGDLYRPRTAEFIRLGQTVGRDELEAARAGRWALRDELAATMAEHGVDVWLSPPALGPAPEGLASTGDPITNLPWTHAGLPTVTVPAGPDSETGLPLGLQCAAGWMADECLLAWAPAIEAALG